MNRTSAPAVDVLFPIVMGIALIAIAIAFIAIMGFFPEGFTEPMSPDTFLASTPMAVPAMMFVAMYVMIAGMVIGGVFYIGESFYILQRRKIIAIE